MARRAQTVPPEPAGYSGTPLAKKLGLAADTKIFTRRAPASYAALVAPLPSGVTFASTFGHSIDIVHVFGTKLVELARDLARWRKTMKPEAVIWVSWPKKASRVPTDITEDRIREVARPLGLVDVKVCAVDDTWSGLKLVIRKELR